MITLQKHKHTTREFRGPAPGSVAILARQPGHRTSDKIIQDMKREADYRLLCEEQAKDIETATIRGEWEKSSRQKMLMASTFREFTKAKQQMQDDIEIRRNRLRKLISEEHNQLLQEVSVDFETVIERQAKLREKARKLKEEKALDNQMTAQMKYDQMWRDQCEQLRTTISKKTAIEIAKDNLELMKSKDIIAQEKRYEDEYFASLWNEEIKKKENREKQDAEKSAIKNMEMTKILMEQKALIEAKRQKEKQLKEEEKILRLEMLELKKLENDNAYEEKLKNQQRTRDIFDTNLRQKLKRQNREMQEEIALDTKIMESLLAGFEAETNLQIGKKKQLMEDSKRYREYLRQLKEQEQAREKELDDIMNEEISKSWQRRVDQWDRETAARKKLLQEVIDIRKQQIEDKIRKNAENQKQAAIERENFMKLMQSYKEEDETKRKSHLEKYQIYRNDLLQQISFNKFHSDMKEVEAENERKAMKEEEVLFQKRIDATLNEDWVDPRAHPWRKVEQPF